MCQRNGKHQRARVKRPEGGRSRPADVPSPIDLRDISDARAWESTALSKRPSRPSFFKTFAVEIRAHLDPVASILELGSGPGFLAKHLLHKLPEIQYTALDFSAAMHQLARERLGDQSDRVQFVERSFKDPDWMSGLGTFDVVVTHQAVHELRHKRHAVNLHRAVGALLPKGGLYLMCDHFVGEGGMTDEQLFMTLKEHQTSLLKAGFQTPELIKTADSLAMFRAIR